jgi:secreted effector protein SseB
MMSLSGFPSIPQTFRVSTAQGAASPSNAALNRVSKMPDFHGTIAQYAMLMMEMNNGEAQNMIHEMQRRQKEGQEAREAANQIESLINEIGSDTSVKKTVGDGIRAFFDKHNIEITVYADGTKKTLKEWESRDKLVGEPGYSTYTGEYTAAQLRSLKAAAEGFTEQASDSRTVDQIKINKKLQEYNGASTLVNTIYSSQGSQLNQINGSMRT